MFVSVCISMCGLEIYVVQLYTGVHMCYADFVGRC